MLAQGYSPLLIFEALCENRQLSVSYRQFCRYVAPLKSLSPVPQSTGAHSSTRSSPQEFIPNPLDASANTARSPNVQAPAVPLKTKGQHKKDEAKSVATLLLAPLGDTVNFNPQHFANLSSKLDSELDSEK